MRHSPRNLPVILAAPLLALTLLSSALAQPEAGADAPPLSGTDMVGKKPASLADFKGHWVLLDFWATWCGPCMEALPELIEASAPYRKDGRLSLVTLSADRPETLADLQQTIAEEHLDFPVLLPQSNADGAALSRWDVSAIPATFLINPEGQVVVRDLQFERIDTVLDFYLNQARPLLHLDTAHKVLDDGTVQVLAEVQKVGAADPGSLKLTLNLAWDEWVYDEKGKDPTLVVDSQEHIEPDFATATVQLDAAGKAQYLFTVPADPKRGAVYYGLSLEVPGSAGRGADGQSPLLQWADSPYITLVEPHFAEDDEFGDPLPANPDPGLADAEDLTEPGAGPGARPH